MVQQHKAGNGQRARAVKDKTCIDGGAIRIAWGAFIFVPESPGPVN